jgi:hypothetical protein
MVTTWNHASSYERLQRSTDDPQKSVSLEDGFVLLPPECTCAMLAARVQT